MIRILQLQRSIRCLTSVRNNVPKTTTTHQLAKFYASSLAETKEIDDKLETQQTRVQDVLGSIQENLKLFGRITNKQMVDLSASVTKTSEINSAQALAAIRCFTDLSVDASPEDRIRRVNELWGRLEGLGVPLDVSHYNALLRAYLDSEHNFNPTEFLSKMADGGVGPNRITYQFLVERYCQTGDVTEATRIMRFMEEKQVPINLNVLNLMIMGHARNNDMEKAKEVLTLMKSKGFTPDESTYGILLSEYARAGDVESILTFFDDRENRDIFLDSRTVSNIVYQLCVNKHYDAVGKVLEHAPVMITNEFHRLAHRLASAKHFEGCIALFNSANINVEESFFTRLGTFVISRAVSDAKTAEDVLKLVHSIPRGDVNIYSVTALRPLLLEHPELAISYIELLEKEDCSLRPQYFFPLVARLARSDDAKGLTRVLLKLRNKTTSLDVYTLYRILRSAGWNHSASFLALIPLRPYVTSVQIAFRSALVHRQYKVAQDIASTKSRFIVGAADALVYSSVLNSYPANEYAALVFNVVACCRRDNEEASDSDAEAAEVEDSASAAAPAAADTAADTAEEAVEPAISTRDLMRMSPQQLTDFIVEKIVQRANDGRIEMILQALVARGLYITASAAEKLTESAKSDEVKALLGQLSSRPLHVPAYRVLAEDTRSDILEEYARSEVMSSQKNFIMTELLINYASNNDRKAADVYKALNGQLQERVIRPYTQYACRNDTAAGLECFRNYSDRRGLDWPFVQLATNLVLEGKLEDALNVIAKKKEFIGSNTDSPLVQRLLVSLSASPNEQAQEILKDVTSNEETAKSLYIRQLNTLTKRNPEEAVNFYEKSCQQYGRFGFRNLAVQLVKEERYELLQKLQNVLTAKLGEDESLYELSLVLLKCRKVPQARRIIEMSNQIGRLVPRLLSTNDQTSLESLLEIIPPYHPRKDEVCEKLLLMYDNRNDAENAVAMWSRLEEESYSLNLQCQSILSNLLKRCGYEVPFECQSEDTSSPGHRRGKVDLSEETIAKFEEKALEYYRDRDGKQFNAFLGGLDPQQSVAVRHNLISKSISDSDASRLKFVLPRASSVRFDCLTRVLGDNTLRANYVKLMYLLVNDVNDLVRAYWLHCFLRGETDTCKSLWRKYSSAHTVSPPRDRMSVLDQHRERYWSLLKEINAPSRVVTSAFIRMLRAKTFQNPEASLGMLKENQDLIGRINPTAAAGIRDDFVNAGASAELLSALDSLWESCVSASTQESVL